MQQLEFDIQPYIGALPIRFGMPRPELSTLFGSQAHPNRRDEDFFGPVRVAYYGVNTVEEIGFVPGDIVLSFMGVELWSASQVADPVPLFLRHDPSPVEFRGFLVFTHLGVTSTGFHDDDRSQRAITVFRRGLWDDMLPRATSPNLARYNTG